VDGTSPKARAGQRDQAPYLSRVCSTRRPFLGPALCVLGSAQRHSRRRGEAYQRACGTALDGAPGEAPRAVEPRRSHQGPCADVFTRCGPTKAVFAAPARVNTFHVQALDTVWHPRSWGTRRRNARARGCTAMIDAACFGAIDRRNCRCDIPVAPLAWGRQIPAARPEIFRIRAILRLLRSSSAPSRGSKSDNCCATSLQDSRACRSPVAAPLVNDIPSTFNPINKTKRCAMGGT